MDDKTYEKLLGLNENRIFSEIIRNKNLKSYIKEVQKELSNFTVSYEGNDIHIQSKKFADVNIKVIIDYKLNNDNTEAGIYYYGTNTLNLNPNLLEKPQNLAAVISHELTHALEDYHVMNSDKIGKQINHPLFPDYIKMLSIYIDDNPVEINCLNFKEMGNGSLHFEPQAKARMESDHVHLMSAVFYAMHKSETEAYRVGEQEMQNFCDYYNKTHNDKIQVADGYNITRNSFQQFKDKYNLVKYSDTEAELLYNKCFLKLNSQQQPENELEANVMYDMACLALYHYRIQKNREIEVNEHNTANDFMDAKTKQQNLRQYGFDIIHPAGYIPHLTFHAPSYMKFMGNEEAFLSEDVFFKKDNMKIFLMIAPEIGSRITEYIPDMDLLKQMCVNDRDELINSGSELMENGIKIIFGEEFWNQLNELPVENIEGTDDIGNIQYEMHSAITFQNPETEYEDNIEL